MSSDFSTVPNSRQAALVAGFSYLAVFIIAAFANSFALERLIVSADAAATADNIINNELLYRLGIAGWLIVMVFDAIVAWALYVLFQTINKTLSLLAAWFRLVFVAIFSISLLNHSSILHLLTQYLDTPDTAPVHAQLMLYLNAYESGVQISFVFFGLHIFLLGYLILQAHNIPRILGILLVIASVGYLINSFGNFLSTTYADSEIAFVLAVAIPAVISEFSLTLWLLIRGGKSNQTSN